MARQFCRWQPELTMVGLRFSNVMDVADYAEFPAFDDDPQLRAGTCGATSTAATARRPCGARSSTARAGPAAPRCSSSRTRTR